MKEAFDLYFKKQEALFRKYFGSLPTVCYTDSLNKSLLVSAPNADGEVEWQPRLQTAAVDWGKLESIIGFRIRDELKAYYGTYLFLSLDGKRDGVEMHFLPIGKNKTVEGSVRQNLSDALYTFPGTQTFLLGGACIDGDDGYFIYFDNNTGQVYCYESDTKNRVELGSSLAEIIADMEAIL